MKNKLKLLPFLALLLFSAAGLISCSSPSGGGSSETPLYDSRLVGKWKYGARTLTFTADGKYYDTDGSGHSGKWKVNETMDIVSLKEDGGYAFSGYAYSFPQNTTLKLFGNNWTKQP